MDNSTRYVLRSRTSGVIFGVTPIMEAMPEMEKIPYAEAFPEKCMPAHIKERVEEATKPAPKNKKKKAAPKLDLTTNDIPDDPEELESQGDMFVADAINEEASYGLDD